MMNDTLNIDNELNRADTVIVDKGINDLQHIYFKDQAGYLDFRKETKSTLAFQKYFISATPKNKDLIPVHYHVVSKDWITILFIISVLIYAWINFIYRKRLKQIFKAFFTGRFVNQLTREGNLLRERLALPLAIIFFITISLYTYYIIFFSGFGNLHKSIDSINYIYIFGAFIIAWSIKVVGVKFIGYLFKIVDFTNDYLLVNYIINFITGILILPFMISAVYLESKVIIILISVILTGIFFFWIFRGLFIGLSNPKISLFYYFLYLCTVEILPFIIVLKSILIVMQITVS